MALKDSEGPVKLLEEDDAGEFVREGHFAEREASGRGFAGGRGETVGPAYGEEDGYCASHLILDEVGELLGAERLAAGVEKHECVALFGVGFAGGEMENGGLIAEFQALDFGIA